MNKAAEFRSNTTGIQHLGLPAANLAETIEFYHGLGFETIWEKPGEVAFLQLGSLMIETYASENPAMRNGAIDHVCLNVKDVEAAWRDAMACGYKTEDSGINFLPFFENGVKFFTIIGPNHEKVEFNQIL